MSTISIHRPKTVDGWQIEPRLVGNRTYHVLVKPDGYVYAQGSANLCKAVLSSLRYDDDAEQLTERFLFHRVYGEGRV